MPLIHQYRALPNMPTEHECWIMHTLLHTPLLRVADLRACTQFSQASLYRLLRGMQARAWIEAIIPPALGHHTGACYYLTERGLQMIAASVDADPVALAQTAGADERGLLRLLPRLGQLVRLQAFLFDLCLSAPEHLTETGQRSAIAWHWLRDYTYAFGWQGRSLTCPVSALLVLRRRPAVPHYPDALREEAAQSQARAHEVWYSVQMLLDSPLLEDRAIHQWLERLSLAATTCTSASFPPVLILVSTKERQALWHATMRHLTETKGVPSLVAALAVVTADLFPPAGSGAAWRLGWQRIGDQAPCHLQEMLVAGTAESVPPAVLTSLSLWEGEQRPSASPEQRAEPDPQSVPPPSTRKRRPPLIAGQFTERITRAIQTRQVQDLPLSLACASLSERAINVLVQIEQHPAASSEELAAWDGVHPSSVARLITQLRRDGWVCSADRLLPASVGDRRERSLLTERGARALARIFHLPHPLHRTAHTEPAESGVWVPKRAAKLTEVHAFAHRAMLYDFFARLARAATEPSGVCLRWWSLEVGTRRYLWHGVNYPFQPDATTEVASGERTRRFWLECATGDPSVRDLARTLSAYAIYLRSRDWMREQVPLPLLCVLVAGPAQERRLARVAKTVLGEVAGCRLAVTTTGRLQQAGVLAPIWWQIMPAEEHAPTAESSFRRVTLMEL